MKTFKVIYTLNGETKSVNKLGISSSSVQALFLTFNPKAEIVSVELQ